MNTRRRAICRRRGVALVEVLMASTIVTFSLAAMISTWYFSFNVTMATDQLGVAYNLTRSTVEQVKESGFYNAPEASVASPTTHYYNSNEVNVDSAPATGIFKVTTSIVSSATVSGSSPTAPQDTALRTVTVKVMLVSTNAALYTVSTYLVRAGI